MIILTDLSHTLYKELLQNSAPFIVLFLPKMSFKYLFIHHVFQRTCRNCEEVLPQGNHSLEGKVQL